MLPEPHGPTLRLKHAEHALRRAVAPALTEAAVTFEQWQVLAALREHPGLRMTDLAELAVLPAATLTRHVDALVARALVIRKVAPDDKRRAVVALSSLGEQLAERVHALEVDADLPLPLDLRR